MAVKPVLDLIRKIFGNKALSKTIGTRTNVITLPDSNIKTLIKNELDINKASDAQLEAFKKQAEQLISEVPKMNDQELLTFKGNLQRYYDRMYPPSAEVFDFQTKAKVPKAGIEQLETKMGIPSDVDPGSPLGRVMQRVKKAEAEGKSLADEFDMGAQLKKGLEDLTQSQKGFRKIEDEGLVRATVRQILDRDRKSGKVKLSKDEDQIITFQNQGDPIDIFRKYYGEDALEQVDSLVPQFRELRTQQEAADLVESKFTLEPKSDRPPGSFDPDEPPEFADGGRVGFANGGTYDRYMANLAEIENKSQANPLASLVVSPSPEITDGNSESVGPTGSVTRGNTTVQSPLGYSDFISALSPTTLAANIASRAMTGRSLSENARRGINSVAAAMGFGGGNAGTTAGTAADPSTAASEDPSAIGSQSPGGSQSDGGSSAGAAAASAAGSNDGPGGGTFADGGRVHAAAGLMKGMIDWLVKNRNFAKELLDRVSKQKNGEKLIKELYEAETKKTGASPVTMGEAPKTDLKKVRGKAAADKRITEELSEEGQVPVKDETIVPEDVMTVPEPFKGKYQQEFLAHDALYGRRSGDNKVDAEAIAETVADMQGKVYDDLGYSERMDLYDKAYGYLSLLDRTKGAMKEASDIQKSGRQLNAGGGLAYLMGL